MHEDPMLDRHPTPPASEKADVEGGVVEAEGTATERPADDAGEADGTDPAVSADPGGDPDPDPDPPLAEEGGDGLAELRAELKQLRLAFTAQEARRARMESEYEEFRTLFPDASLTALPDAVWQDVAAGSSLAAAFALFERRRAHTLALAVESNARNQQRSAGALHGTDSGDLTPAEVRAMTPLEVRTNYEKIMRSMQKWR